MLKDIIVLCGFSASGKDTLARELEKSGYEFIVSTTTRPMRGYESQKDPYHFINNFEFEHMIVRDELIEFREYNTLVNNEPARRYYGVEKKSVNESLPNVVVLDIVGLRDFKKYFGDRVLSFFIYCDEETRKERCIARGDFNETEFNRRLEDDRKVFPREVIEHEMDFVIESTNIEDNLKETLKIIEDQNNPLT